MLEKRHDIQDVSSVADHELFLYYRTKQGLSNAHLYRYRTKAFAKTSDLHFRWIQPLSTAYHGASGKEDPRRFPKADSVEDEKGRSIGHGIECWWRHSIVFNPMDFFEVLLTCVSCILSLQTSKSGVLFSDPGQEWCFVELAHGHKVGTCHSSIDSWWKM